METEGPGLRDFVAMARRRWIVIATPAVFGLGLAAIVATVLPSTYTSRARILVESQAIPEDLARSTVTSGPTERIRLIEQRILSRETLLEIAGTFSLFADRDGLSPTEIVDLLRRAIRLETVILAREGTGPRASTTALAVDLSFSAESPEIAARVANDLLTRILEQNLAVRSSSASETFGFFDREVTGLSSELTAAEGAISSFKAENKDSLPDTLGFRFDAAATLEERMFAREARRVVIEEQLRALRAPALLGASGMRADPLLVEILRMRQELELQRAIYAESHPTIRALSARLARLESGREAAMGPATGATDDASQSAGDSSQTGPLQRELELLAAQLVVDRERLDALRDSIQRTPAVETELSRLMRTRDAVASQYTDAVAKRARAATGERLEVNQQGERLEVIEQPITPTAPSSPNRPLIIAGGAAIGLCLGGGIALLLELAFPFLRTGRDVHRKLGMRPFVTVPFLESPRARLMRRMRLAASAALLLAAIPAGLWVVDHRYMPLSVLADRAARETGVARIVDLVRARFSS